MKLIAKAILKKAEGNRAGVWCHLEKVSILQAGNARYLEWGGLGVAKAPSWEGRSELT